MAVSLPVEGLHPTSVSCLEALQGLEGDFLRVLDMGCGSGLLGVFMAIRYPAAQVLAADISVGAVADTQALVDAQGLGERVKVVRSDGFSHGDIAKSYDLIICNLLAEPIVGMAGKMKARAAEGAVLVLSGILAWMAAEVEMAYAAQGFVVQSRVVREPWHTLVLKNNLG